MWLVPALFAMLMNARESVSHILTFCLHRWTHAEKVPKEYHLPHALKKSQAHGINRILKNNLVPHIQDSSPLLFLTAFSYKISNNCLNLVAQPSL